MQLPGIEAKEESGQDNESGGKKLSPLLDKFFDDMKTKPPSIQRALFLRLLFSKAFEPLDKQTIEQRERFGKKISNAIRAYPFVGDIKKDLKPFLARLNEIKASLPPKDRRAQWQILFNMWSVYVVDALEHDLEQNLLYCRYISDFFFANDEYEYSFFYRYWVYHYSKEKLVLDVLHLFSLTVTSSKDSWLRSCRNYFLHELIATINISKQSAVNKFNNNKVLDSLFQLELKSGLLTGSEKRLLLDCISAINLPIEQKYQLFFTYIKHAKESLGPQVLVEFSKICDQVTHINHEDLLVLQSVLIKQENFAFVSALTAMFSKLARKFNYSDSQNFSSSNILKVKVANKNDGLEDISKMLASFCHMPVGMMLNVTPLIDILYTQIAKHGIEVIDYLADRYLQKNAKATIYLLYSFDKSILDRVSDQFFLQLMTEEQFYALLSSAFEYGNAEFVDCLLTKFERIPLQHVGQRAKILNKIQPFFLTPLKAAIKSQRDIFALRLYKLGARTLGGEVQAADRIPGIFSACIDNCCYQLLAHMLVAEKALRNEQEEIEQRYIRLIASKIGFAIKKLPRLLSLDTDMILREGLPFARPDQMHVYYTLLRAVLAQELVRKSEKPVLAEEKLLLQIDYLTFRELFKQQLNVQPSSLLRYLESGADNYHCSLLVLESLYYPDLITSDQSRVLSILRKTLKEIPIAISSFIDTVSLQLRYLPNNRAQVVLNAVYLLFEEFIYKGEFDSPALIYLFLKLPPLEFVYDESTMTGKQYLVLSSMYMVGYAYTASLEIMTNVLTDMVHPDSRHISVAVALGQEHLLLIKLPAFLLTIRPELTSLIESRYKLVHDQYFREVRSTQMLTPDSYVEYLLLEAVKHDHLDGYKSLSEKHPEAAKRKKLTHILASCGEENSMLLTYLLKHEPGKYSFDEAEKFKLFQHIIANDWDANLRFVLSCSHLKLKTAHLEVLYLDALKQQKYRCATELMPTIVTNDLLMRTATEGTAKLFEKALNANSNLVVKGEVLVSFEQLESLCIEDKDKLTVIALARVNSKKRWDDQFGTAEKKPRAKVKNSNPGGEELYLRFRHQFDVLLSYAKIHAHGEVLTEEDFHACHLNLIELVAAHNACGKNIKTFLKDDALFGQLQAFIQNLITTLKSIGSEEQLDEITIKTQLEFISAFRSKQAKEADVLHNQSDSRKHKKNKKNSRKQREKVQDQPQVPIVISNKKSIYEEYPLQKRLSDTNQSSVTNVTVIDQKDEINLSDTLMAIRKDIESVIFSIKELILNLPNYDELEYFADDVCTQLIKSFKDLKILFFELDDDLFKTPYVLLKEQLDLVEFSLNVETKQQLSLIAKNLLNNNQPIDNTPKKLAERVGPLPILFQPAVLQEDLNKFCLVRIQELSKILSSTRDIIAIHCCVFRIVNALGDVYRPARKIRHLLIHEFYNIQEGHLIELATVLIHLDLSSKRNYFAIENCTIYRLSEGWFQKLLQPEKREQLNPQLICRGVVNNLHKAKDTNDHLLGTWFVALLGELCNKFRLDFSLELERDCRLIRNKVAHENYVESLCNKESCFIGNIPAVKVMATIEAICASTALKVGPSLKY